MGLRASVLRTIRGKAYRVVLACLTLLNATLILLQSDYAARHTGDEMQPRSAHHFGALVFAFAAMFFVDIVVRIVAEGALFFYFKRNCLDFVVVVCMAADVILLCAGDSQKAWLILVPLLRLVRFLRIVTMLSTFASFRDMRVSFGMLCDCLTPLLSFSAIMVVFCAMFGILFTDGTTVYLASYGVDEELTTYFGGVLITMCTLFQAITGGVDWEQPAGSLAKLSSAYVVAFYVYIALSMLVMLNIVSAIFIDSSLQRSKNDRDFIVQQELSGKRHFKEQMHDLFSKLDKEGTGKIYLRELRKYIEDPKTNAYFRAIDLNPIRVHKMFLLMDTDGSGDVDRHEFLDGCERLRGDAKELDLAILEYELRDGMTRLSSAVDQMNGLTLELGDFIDERLNEEPKLREPSVGTRVGSQPDSDTRYIVPE